MIYEEQFESLLAKMEGETVDFKADAYDLSNEEVKFSLIKDVLCMANTPRESSSFIVLGVKKYPDGTYDLRGIEKHVDEADIQSQFTERVYPIPNITYYPVIYHDKQFGIIEVFPTRVGPCIPVRDYGNRLRQWQIYFRRGSKNDIALPEDSTRILSWFGKKVPPRGAYENGGVSWEKLLLETHIFDSARYFILILSPYTQNQITDLRAIGLIPWIAAFDFDPESDAKGVLYSCKEVLEKYRSVHLITTKDRPTINLRTGTYWFFPRGIAGREETIEIGPWRTWQKVHGGAVAEQIKRLAAACAPTPVTCLALWYDASLTRHLQSVLDATLGAFGDAANIIILTDNLSELQAISDESGAIPLEIPIHQFCSGISSIFQIDNELIEEGLSFPCSSGAPMPASTVLSEKDKFWLEEELDLVHIGSGLVAPLDRTVGRDFLRGAEISWFELGLHSDIERDILDKLQRQVERDLQGRRTARINLYHAPGGGGTTVARRVLWNLHRRFPCAILRRTSPLETSERLFRLSSLTGLPMLLLIDGSEIAERQVDELYDLLRSRHIPTVLLQVIRRFTPQVGAQRAFYLQSELSIAEANRFTHVLTHEAPERKRDIEALINSPDPRFRSAFYFGISAFHQDFLGLESFVSARLDLLNQVQKKIIGFLALSHHYAQRPLPAQSFAELLGIPHSRTVDFTTIIPQATLDLLVQVDPRVWRTAHDIVANEILEQLLWPTSSDRRLWKQNLSNWALEFAELCRGSAPVPSEAMLEVARRIFIYRDNIELLGTERSATRQFAQIYQDLPSREGKLIVLQKLTELYPEEAHFWAHLGRFISIELQDYIEASVCIEHAIALNEYDHVLHHMKGMALRQQTYRIMENNGPLPDILELAKQSSISFSRARELNPDDEHGYISEVQMLARIMDYAGKNYKGGFPEYLASAAIDPFLGDCFERAENLLEIIRRNREGGGASSFEEDCRARIDALYGRHERALQIWDNLLARKDVYGPPVRRQIVWTYLARRGRSWDAIPRKEVDRIVSLLEDNLQEEPNSDTNLRLWVQAIRRSSYPLSIEAIIERVGHWRASSNSLDASYYLYVFYALQAIEGSTLGRDSAVRFLDECKTKARFRRNRTKSFEWLGSGSGISRLVHHSQLGDWQREKDFWENTEPLLRLPGRIASIEAPQAGQIEVQGGLKAFFVPARGNYSRGHSENKSVTFFLGFSYDGLRAWEVKDA